MNIALRPLLRLTLPWNALLSLPAMVIAPLVAVITADGGPIATARALTILELGSTAVAVIAFAHLMVIDVEERALELRFTYPPRRFVLVVERFVPAALILLAGTLISWAVLRVAAPGLTLAAALTTALPPAVALTSAALLAGATSGNVWVASAVPLAWWGACFATSRHAPSEPFVRQLVKFHLFQACRPVNGVDFAANRWLLVLVAALCLAACVILVSRRESWLNRQ